MALQQLQSFIEIDVNSEKQRKEYKLWLPKSNNLPMCYILANWGFWLVQCKCTQYIIQYVVRCGQLDSYVHGVEWNSNHDSLHTNWHVPLHNNTFGHNLTVVHPICWLFSILGTLAKSGLSQKDTLYFDFTL